MHRHSSAGPRAAFGLLLPLLLSAIACHTALPPDDTIVPSPGVTVAVTNGGLSAADVFAIRWGGRFRIGFVQSYTTETLRVPPTALTDGDLVLVVHLVGESGSDYYAGPMHVNPGDRARLDIAPVLQFSSYAVEVIR
jgi:hypothetical protein